jgi:hypothetical protein
MTIRADDVAIRDLLEKGCPWLKQYLPRCEGELFSARVSVVEVHDPGRERSATVLAGHPSQISQEPERRCLTDAHALDLFFAMGGVVRDVVRALIAPALHIWS